MRWPWSGWLARHAPDGEAMQARQRAEAERARIARRRPLVEQRARELADLPDDEFAAEVARVFRAKRQRRPA